jgi:hypothetical protein
MFLMYKEANENCLQNADMYSKDVIKDLDSQTRNNKNVLEYKLHSATLLQRSVQEIWGAFLAFSFKKEILGFRR